MGITKEAAMKLLPEGIPMDPHFPDETQCDEEHVKHMFRGPVPVMFNLRRAVVGQRAMTTYPTLGMFAAGDRDIGHLGAGHVFLMGKPGIGKTLLAKIPSLIVGGTSSRIQGVPDALPADYLGNRIIDIDDKDGKRYFRLVKGPAFSHFQIIDEANRFNPRMHAAFLQVLSEGKITIGTETHDVGPFVIFTANYLESEGVYEIPDAEKDRILFMILSEDFTAAEFAEILRVTQTFHTLQFKQVCTIEDVFETRRFFHETVIVSDEIRNKHIGRFAEISNNPHKFGYLNDLAKELDDNPIIVGGLSGRGNTHLESAARTLAAFKYRSYVTTDDVFKVLLPVLRHRAIFPAGALQFFCDKWKDQYTVITRDKILKKFILEAWWDL